MPSDNIFSGLKVVDLASFIAGPSAAVILSDFGADVIKVEPPVGDLWRHGHQIPPQPQANVAYPWHLANRNKRGMTLDLKIPSAQQVLEKLVRWADVLIVNTPHPARKRLKLEYDDVAEWNPRLIYSDVTGFGDKGPDFELPGFEIDGLRASGCHSESKGVLCVAQCRNSPKMPRTRAKTMRAAPSRALRRIASTRMPTKWGIFNAIGFERDGSNGTRRVETALAIVMGDLTQGIPMLRIHSQCFTGEVLGSLRCDCRNQLEMAMQAIAEEGCGLVIYEYQEGRGIGLMAKLKAYELQDAGLDTVDANHVLGFKTDCRDFSLPAAILSEFRIRRVRLMSNNPRKTQVPRDAGIEVVDELPCEAKPTMHSLGYLKTKKEKLGHTLSSVSD